MVSQLSAPQVGLVGGARNLGIADPRGISVSLSNLGDISVTEGSEFGTRGAGSRVNSEMALSQIDPRELVGISRGSGGRSLKRNSSARSGTGGEGGGRFKFMGTTKAHLSYLSSRSGQTHSSTSSYDSVVTAFPLPPPATAGGTGTGLKKGEVEHDWRGMGLPPRPK